MMNILSCTGDSDLARVCIASFDDDPSRLVEFVNARDPELPVEAKRVIIVSTQFGCPIGCLMCDAGSDFRGNLTAAQIMAQVDHAVSMWHAGGPIACRKFKIQFARMGEPALNPAVLEVLRDLPGRYDAPGLIPCIATAMPRGSEEWFVRLMRIKREYYGGRLFQLQISINTTDAAARDRLMPHPKWDLGEIAAYGASFVAPGERKIALNFAWTERYPVNPEVIRRHFDPRHFCVKITPLNPTIAAGEKSLSSAFDPLAPHTAAALCDDFSRLGFDTILSIGDVRENEIGSNCGMSVRTFRT